MDCYPVLEWGAVLECRLFAWDDMMQGLFFHDEGRRKEPRTGLRFSKPSQLSWCSGLTTWLGYHKVVVVAFIELSVEKGSHDAASILQRAMSTSRPL